MDYIEMNLPLLYAPSHDRFTRQECRTQADSIDLVLERMEATSIAACKAYHSRIFYVLCRFYKDGTIEVVK